MCEKKYINISGVSILFRSPALVVLWSLVILPLVSAPFFPAKLLHSHLFPVFVELIKMSEVPFIALRTVRFHSKSPWTRGMAVTSWEQSEIRRRYIWNEKWYEILFQAAHRKRATSLHSNSRAGQLRLVSKFAAQNRHVRNVNLWRKQSFYCCRPTFGTLATASGRLARWSLSLTEIKR